MRTTISALAWAASSQQVFHALSVDQPISPNFVDEQPHLIKKVTPPSTVEVLFQWDNVYDIPEGTHTLYYRCNDSQDVWRPLLYVNDKLLTAQKLAPNYYAAEFTVSHAVTEPINIYIVPNLYPHGRGKCYRIYPDGEERDDFCCQVTGARTRCLAEPPDVDPTLNPAKTLYRATILLHLYYETIGDSPLSSVRAGKRNLIWLGYKDKYYEAKPIRIIATPLQLPFKWPWNTPYPPEPGDYSQNIPSGACVVKDWGATPISEAVALPEVPYLTDSAIIEYGYISPAYEESIRTGAMTEIDPRAFVKTGEVSVSIEAIGTNPPPNYYGGIQNISIIATRLTNPIKPTRDTLMQIIVSVEGNCTPYIRIKELPFELGMATGVYHVGTQEISKTFYLNDRILRQGYVTVEYGRIIPDSPIYEALGEMTVAIAPSRIDSISIERVAPYSRIDAISIERLPPTLPACRVDALTIERIPVPSRIDSISIERILPPSRIDSISIERIPAPPPPPEYASLKGMVRGWLIGAISGAQVNLDTKTTTTDPSGYYYFRDLPLGSYTLQATPPFPYSLALRKAIQMVSLTEPKEYTQDLYLPPDILKVALMSAGGVAFLALLAWSVS